MKTLTNKEFKNRVKQLKSYLVLSDFENNFHGRSRSFWN